MKSTQIDSITSTTRYVFCHFGLLLMTGDTIIRPIIMLGVYNESVLKYHAKENAVAYSELTRFKNKNKIKNNF